MFLFSLWKEVMHVNRRAKGMFLMSHYFEHNAQLRRNLSRSRATKRVGLLK